MLRITRIHTYTSQGAQSASQAWHRVAAQPSSITRIALLTFLFVIGIPILLLLMVAIVLSVIVFTLLSLSYGIWMRLRGTVPRKDGRENVRIMHRPGAPHE